MTVPTQLSVIPQYMIISELGWVDTLQALIIPGLMSAFGIFWMRQHIAHTIDDELMQAARVDGATTWQIFWRVAFPLIRRPGHVRFVPGHVAAAGAVHLRGTAPGQWDHGGCVQGLIDNPSARASPALVPAGRRWAPRWHPVA
jgi:hypothetical protein